VKVPASEGLANHTVPESCVRSSREAHHEALTGVRAGQPLSRDRSFTQDADAVRKAEGNTGRCARRAPAWSCEVVDPGMRVSSLHGNREISRLASRGTGLVRIGKARSRSR
jgi:hypothetical protein